MHMTDSIKPVVAHSSLLAPRFALGHLSLPCGLTANLSPELQAACEAEGMLEGEVTEVVVELLA